MTFLSHVTILRVFSVLQGNADEPCKAEAAPALLNRSNSSNPAAASSSSSLVNMLNGSSSAAAASSMPALLHGQNSSSPHLQSPLILGSDAVGTSGMLASAAAAAARP
jgi:hypothetical protein